MFMLVYKGIGTDSPVERDAIARELAFELDLPVDRTTELMQWIGSPLCRQLSQEEARKLTGRLTGMGVYVEMRIDGEISEASQRKM